MTEKMMNNWYFGVIMELTLFYIGSRQWAVRKRPADIYVWPLGMSHWQDDYLTLGLSLQLLKPGKDMLVPSIADHSPKDYSSDRIAERKLKQGYTKLCVSWKFHKMVITCGSSNDLLSNFELLTNRLNEIGKKNNQFSIVLFPFA